VAARDPHGRVVQLSHYLLGSIAAVPRLHAIRSQSFRSFALEDGVKSWADIDQALVECPNNPAVERGRREITYTLEDSMRYSASIYLRIYGPLARFPADNQVLQRREGIEMCFVA
jgi:hypothetical protein